MTCSTHNETSWRPVSILVVDDEPSSLNLIAEVIRASGRNFREASDRATAIEALWENFRDLELLVANVHAPQLDGLRLVKRAREIAPDLKVVVTSAGLEAAERQAIEELGVTAYLQKPLSASEMKSCIDAILA